MRTTVTERGQTVVPAAIRRSHAIETRSRLEWIDDGRSIRVVPIPADPIAAAQGSSKGLGNKLREVRALERARR